MFPLWAHAYSNYMSSNKPKKFKLAKISGKNVFNFENDIARGFTRAQLADRLKARTDLDKYDVTIQRNGVELGRIVKGGYILEESTDKDTWFTTVFGYDRIEVSLDPNGWFYTEGSFEREDSTRVTEQQMASYIFDNGSFFIFYPDENKYVDKNWSFNGTEIHKDQWFYWIFPRFLTALKDIPINMIEVIRINLKVLDTYDNSVLKKWSKKRPKQRKKFEIYCGKESISLDTVFNYIKFMVDYGSAFDTDSESEEPRKEEDVLVSIYEKFLKYKPNDHELNLARQVTYMGKTIEDIYQRKEAFKKQIKEVREAMKEVRNQIIERQRKRVKELKKQAERDAKEKKRDDSKLQAFNDRKRNVQSVWGNKNAIMCIDGKTLDGEAQDIIYMHKSKKGFVQLTGDNGSMSIISSKDGNTVLTSEYDKPDGWKKLNNDSDLGWYYEDGKIKRSELCNGNVDFKPPEPQTENYITENGFYHMKRVNGVFQKQLGFLPDPHQMMSMKYGPQKLLLAHRPGYGKTINSILLAIQRKKRWERMGVKKKILVLAPSSKLLDHWKSEIQRFGAFDMNDFYFQTYDIFKKAETITWNCSANEYPEYHHLEPKHQKAVWEEDTLDKNDYIKGGTRKRKDCSGISKARETQGKTRYCMACNKKFDGNKDIFNGFMDIKHDAAKGDIKHWFHYEKSTREDIYVTYPWREYEDKFLLLCGCRAGGQDWEFYHGVPKGRYTSDSLDKYKDLARDALNEYRETLHDIARDYNCTVEEGDTLYTVKQKIYASMEKENLLEAGTAKLRSIFQGDRKVFRFRVPQECILVCDEIHTQVKTKHTESLMALWRYCRRTDDVILASATPVESTNERRQIYLLGQLLKGKLTRDEELIEPWSELASLHWTSDPNMYKVTGLLKNKISRYNTTEDKEKFVDAMFKDPREFSEDIENFKLDPSEIMSKFTNSTFEKGKWIDGADKAKRGFNTKNYMAFAKDAVKKMYTNKTEADLDNSDQQFPTKLIWNNKEYVDVPLDKTRAISTVHEPTVPLRNKLIGNKFSLTFNKAKHQIIVKEDNKGTFNKNQIVQLQNDMLRGNYFEVAFKFDLNKTIVGDYQRMHEIDPARSARSQIDTSVYNDHRHEVLKWLDLKPVFRPTKNSPIDSDKPYVPGILTSKVMQVVKMIETAVKESKNVMVYHPNVEPLRAIEYALHMRKHRQWETDELLVYKTHAIESAKRRFTTFSEQEYKDAFVDKYFPGEGIKNIPYKPNEIALREELLEWYKRSHREYYEKNVIKSVKSSERNIFKLLKAISEWDLIQSNFDKSREHVDKLIAEELQLIEDVESISKMPKKLSFKARTNYIKQFRRLIEMKPDSFVEKACKTLLNIELNKIQLGGVSMFDKDRLEVLKVITKMAGGDPDAMRVDGTLYRTFKDNFPTSLNYWEFTQDTRKLLDYNSLETRVKERIGEFKRSKDQAMPYCSKAKFMAFLNKNKFFFDQLKNINMDVNRYNEFGAINVKATSGKARPVFDTEWKLFWKQKVGKKIKFGMAEVDDVVDSEGQSFDQKLSTNHLIRWTVAASIKHWDNVLKDVFDGKVNNIKETLSYDVLNTILSNPNIGNNKGGEPLKIMDKEFKGIEKDTKKKKKDTNKNKRDRDTILNELRDRMEGLEERPLYYGFIADRVSDDKYEAYKAGFANGEIDCILMNGAGIEGIDYKSCSPSVMISLQPVLSPGKQDQFNGRTIRRKSHQILPPHMRKVEYTSICSVPNKKATGVTIPRTEVNTDNWEESKPTSREYESRSRGFDINRKVEQLEGEFIALSEKLITETLLNVLTDQKGTNEEYAAAVEQWKQNEEKKEIIRKAYAVMYKNKPIKNKTEFENMMETITEEDIDRAKNMYGEELYLWRKLTFKEAMALMIDTNPRTWGVNQIEEALNSDLRPRGTWSFNGDKTSQAELVKILKERKLQTKYNNEKAVIKIPKSQDIIKQIRKLVKDYQTSTNTKVQDKCLKQLQQLSVEKYFPIEGDRDKTPLSKHIAELDLDKAPAAKDWQYWRDEYINVHYLVVKNNYAFLNKTQYDLNVKQNERIKVLQKVEKYGTDNRTKFYEITIFGESASYETHYNTLKKEIESMPAYQTFLKKDVSFCHVCENESKNHGVCDNCGTELKIDNKYIFYKYIEPLGQVDSIGTQDQVNKERAKARRVFRDRLEMALTLNSIEHRAKFTSDITHTFVDDKKTLYKRVQGNNIKTHDDDWFELITEGKVIEYPDEPVPEVSPSRALTPIQTPKKKLAKPKKPKPKNIFFQVGDNVLYKEKEYYIASLNPLVLDDGEGNRIPVDNIKELEEVREGDSGEEFVVGSESEDEYLSDISIQSEY